LQLSVRGMDQLQQQEEEEDGGLKDGGLEALFQPETAASRVERAELRLTDSQTVRRVYLLAGLVARLLAEADITHWTSGGTTLGIVRHSGLIPWDDDIDLCILSQDAGKLKLLGTELEGAGCGIVQSNSYLWKIFHLTDSEEVRGRRVQYRYPAADLFIMNRHRGGYQLADKAGRAAWPAEQYTVEQVAGLEYRQFGPHFLPCPASPEIYLDRMYGSDWREVGRTGETDHAGDAFLQPVAFPLTPHLSRPALALSSSPV